MVGYFLSFEAIADEVGSSAPSIPYKTSSVFENIDIMTVLFSLVFCLLIGLLLIYLINKLGYGKQVVKQGKKRLMILETKKISTKQIVSIIQVDGTEYLIASTDSGCHIVRHSETSADKEAPNVIS